VKDLVMRLHVLNTTRSLMAVMVHQVAGADSTSHVKEALKLLQDANWIVHSLLKTKGFDGLLNGLMCDKEVGLWSMTQWHHDSVRWVIVAIPKMTFKLATVTVYTGVINQLAVKWLGTQVAFTNDSMLSEWLGNGAEACDSSLDIVKAMKVVHEWVMDEYEAQLMLKHQQAQTTAIAVVLQQNKEFVHAQSQMLAALMSGVSAQEGVASKSTQEDGASDVSRPSSQ
jgi:hypothetical protein